jgi:PHS family inorganic phosphate transporter-like MFS transporter
MALTLPFVKLAYYSPLSISSGEETLLRVAVLLGMLVGQLTFGFLSDLYGRRKLYGYELMIILLAIVGVTMSSPGLVGSMSLFSWLFVWRFIMGFGKHVQDFETPLIL